MLQLRYTYLEPEDDIGDDHDDNDMTRVDGQIVPAQFIENGFIGERSVRV
jgi:hypothetical protein